MFDHMIELNNPMLRTVHIAILPSVKIVTTSRTITAKEKTYKVFAAFALPNLKAIKLSTINNEKGTTL